ncbi:MAG: hypothetical protein V7L26_03475 [Nostoc sp.]|uniref:hypothetical protein n=1 Tax=Nostoc sp. TaxID=1180 RepID=UPI002FF38870
MNYEFGGLPCGMLAKQDARGHTLVTQSVAGLNPPLIAPAASESSPLALASPNVIRGDAKSERASSF